jgi:hypothetical protein
VSSLRLQRIDRPRASETVDEAMLDRADVDVLGDGG